MLQEPYLKRIAECETEKRKLRPLFDFFGYAKLAVLILCLWFLYRLPALWHSLWYEAGFTLSLLCLIYFWIRQGRLEERIEYLKGIIRICRQYVDRMEGRWISFPDKGEEFLDAGHFYGRDLDMVGEKSLFQFLNSAGTWRGRRRFARDLLQPPDIPEEIVSRQEAVRELSGLKNFVCDVQYAASFLGADASAERLIKMMGLRKRFLKSGAIRGVLRIFPWISFLFMLSALIFRVQGLYMPAFYLLLLQCVVWAVGVPGTKAYLEEITNIPYRLSSCARLISLLEKQMFLSEKLCRIQQALSEQNGGAAYALRELERIAGRVRIRHNPLIYFFLNLLFFWDYSCAFHLEDWREKYAENSEEWFELIGEFESLLSLSNLANVCGNVCLPQPVREDGLFTALALGHPLLADSVRVDNDLELCDGIFIISGSNMSGKTTFLRTAGVNLTLACAGGFVCAREMRFSAFSVVTSMRVTDDLSEGVSTFYAELKRIKTIVSEARAGRKILFLIDEIFRGTNSADRLYGAETVIGHLDSLGVCGMISTHDLELCRLEEKSTRIRNFNFSEYYENDRICFDYKMRAGCSRTSNAQFLMKLAGIL